MTKEEALEILELVTDNPDKETVKKAYIRLSKIFHPDRNSSSSKNKDFFDKKQKDLNEARETLYENYENQKDYYNYYDYEELKVSFEEVMVENYRLKLVMKIIYCVLSISWSFLLIFFFDTYKDFLLGRNKTKDLSGSTVRKLTLKTFLSTLFTLLGYLILLIFASIFAFIFAPIIAFFVFLRLFFDFFKRVFSRKKISTNHLVP